MCRFFGGPPVQGDAFWGPRQDASLSRINKNPSTIRNRVGYQVYIVRLPVHKEGILLVSSPIWVNSGTRNKPNRHLWNITISQRENILQSVAPQHAISCWKGHFNLLYLPSLLVDLMESKSTPTLKPRVFSADNTGGSSLLLQCHKRDLHNWVRYTRLITYGI